ncbi:MAG: hypothetical protein E7680_04635 [Ruminococcaceae bacterium]|nr:hypothetical protein [Oscillospiraceae bacterium]
MAAVEISASSYASKKKFRAPQQERSLKVFFRAPREQKAPKVRAFGAKKGRGTLSHTLPAFLQKSWAKNFIKGGCVWVSMSANWLGIRFAGAKKPVSTPTLPQTLF